MEISQDQNLMQSLPFWVGVFVVTALVGVCCTMSDSQPAEQEVAHNTHKKKNKSKKKKAEHPAEPALVVQEEAPKKKAKQAQEPKKAPAAAAPTPSKKVVAKPAPAWDSDDSDVEIVKPSNKKGQPAKRQEVAKKQPTPAAKDTKKQKKEEPVVVVQEEIAPVNQVENEDEWDEWNEIKDKKQVHKPKQVQAQTQGSSFGGMTSKGYLVAGPVAQPQNRFGGNDAWGNSGPSKPKHEVVNHASAVADYDFGVGRDVDSKFEKYSHVCASSVAQARCDAKLSQAQLAQKVNDKPSTITDLENCTGRYNSDLVNRIEKALQVQIPRGRKGSSKK